MLHPMPAAAQNMLVVIPAYNEAGRVGAVVRDVRRVLPSAEVLVVDDGSSDHTGSEAVRAGATVVTMPVNSGYGAALQTGYKYAVRHEYDVIGQLDADGQHEARYLVPMLEALERDGCDVVIGSRFLGRDGHYRAPAARRAGIELFSRIATALTRQHVTDPTSGFQVLSSDVAKFFCTNVYPADYPDADILILLHRSGFRLDEVPVQMRPSAGQSMHGGHRSLYYVYKMLLSIFVTILRPRSGTAR
jgi:glycosyltransferase involved in cell wall biosynthesis